MITSTGSLNALAFISFLLNGSNSHCVSVVAGFVFQRQQSLLSHHHQSCWLQLKENHEANRSERPKENVFKRTINRRKHSFLDCKHIDNHDDRDIPSLLSWGEGIGVLINKDCIRLVDDSVDPKVVRSSWSVKTAQSSKKDTIVMQIPSTLILSSDRIRTEIDSKIDPTLQHLIKKEFKDCQDASIVSLFYIFLKVLMEYEMGANSKWYPWIQSLPRTFDTAVCMNEVELDCLPAFAYAMAQTFCNHWNRFQRAVKLLPILSPTVRNDTDLLRWAFNIVYTRSWHQQDKQLHSDEECDKHRSHNNYDIVPFGDLFNHGQQNVHLEYDADTNKGVVISLRNDTAADAPLYLSYGKPTNPYRFLVVFGFVDESQESMFCHLALSNPTMKDIEMGYNPESLVINTGDGSIPQNVFYFTLYTILSQEPQIQGEFYEACRTKNCAQVEFLYSRYHLETCIVLRNHIDRTIQEMADLLIKIDSIVEGGTEWNPRLSLIRKNNLFVWNTFCKAKKSVDEMIKAEMVIRKKDN